MSATVAGPAPVLPIAGFKDVYDVSSVDRALHELPPTANEALRAVYEDQRRTIASALADSSLALHEWLGILAQHGSLDR